MRLIRALRPAETLSAENRHELQRLIISYVRYDQTCAERFRLGLITKAHRTDTAQMNVAQTEMRQADADATIHEAELGITPRRRGTVTKTKKVHKTSRASYIYFTNQSIE